jgi:hypothetical protein
VWPTFYIPSLCRENPLPADYCEIFPVGAGTWVKPARATWVVITCIGGGGGGGSGAVGNAQPVQGGQGGGGGERVARLYRAGDLPATVSITVGAGGTGGASVSAPGPNNPGNDGTAGGDTTFGTYITAKGGGRGARGNAGAVAYDYENGGGAFSTFNQVYNGGHYYDQVRGRAGARFPQPTGVSGDPFRRGAGGGGGGGKSNQAPILDATDGHPSPDGTVAGGAGGITDNGDAMGTPGTAAGDHADNDAGAGGGGGGASNYFDPQAPGAYGAAGADGGKFGGGGGGGGGAGAFGTPNSVSGPGGDGAPGTVRACYYFAWDDYEYSNEEGTDTVPVAPAGFTYEAATYRVLRVRNPGAGTNGYPRNPARPIGHPEYDDYVFWKNEYETARLAGLVPSGWIYGLNYPATQGFGYYKPV